MRRVPARLLLLGCIPLLAACGTVPQSVSPTDERGLDAVGEAALIRDMRPRNGVPVFLGVAHRRHNRAEEETRAIEHVARQASRYLRISAHYQYISQRGSDGIGYLDDIITEWDENRAAELMDSVEVISSTRTDAGTLLTARVSGLPEAPDLSHIDVVGDNGKPPRWVAHTPEVPGYLVAIGTAQRRRTMKDTLDYTDQEALKALLIQTGSTLRMVEDRRSVEGLGTAGSVTSAEEAQATLAGFQVVARYASADGRYHYSLAIAREE